MAAAAQLIPPLDVPALTDGKVALRPFTYADTENVVDAVADPALWRWLALARPLSSAEQVRVWMWEGWQQATAGTATRLAVTYDGEFAGCVEMTLYENGVSAMGYWTVQSMRGRGVARRAVKLLSDWALESGTARFVDLLCLPGNEASVKAALAAGFFPDNQFTCEDRRVGGPVTFDVFTRPEPA